MSAPPDAAAVRRYYEASTARFLRLGGSGASVAIHRGLWAPGITTPAEAASHVNDLIAELAETALGRAPERVLDMGCGVGGSLLHLGKRWPEAGLHGITLSAEQTRIATSLSAERGLAGRMRVVQGDFLAVGDADAAGDAAADLVIAIESHVHAPSAQAFLAAAARRVRDGGLLVIVDDMLARPEDTLSPRERARLDAFRRGWHLGHVPTTETLAAVAATLGLMPSASQDLTPLLHLRRARDVALRLAGPAADALGLGRWPIFANMIGGNALTESYRAGTMRYCLAAFRKTEGVTR
jgi:cyclopropane fatty-acyl-phospholipid synthase-like methyltransferase